MQSREEIKQFLYKLFAGGEPTNLTKEVDRQISAILESFLCDNRVTSDIELGDLVKIFQTSKIPLESSDFKSYIDYLSTNVISHSMNTASPKFVGHMTSALPYFVQPLGKLMTGLNQNLVKLETSKALSPYERQALAMIHRLIYNFPEDFYQENIQYKDSTLGIMVSGGTLANITALWCARNSLLGPKGSFTGIENEGLAAALDFYGYKGAVIIGSSLMHYSFDKAADLLGIGLRNLIKVPADQNNRITIVQLKQAIEECQERKQAIIAIVGIAGTTDSGGVDPLEKMAELAQSFNIHFHVDAAWGGPLLFSTTHRHKLSGIEKADSVTIDGHKQLYLPMGIGLSIFRNAKLAKSIQKQARYIVREGSVDLGKRALEGSRPGMALFLHAALNIIGWQGYEVLIDEGINKTQHLAKTIKSRSEFELLSEPEINILLYRYIPKAYREKIVNGSLTIEDNKSINKFNESLQKLQRQSGNTFVSRTTSETTRYGSQLAIVALRAVIANPLTTETDLDSVLDDQIKIATSLELS